jgi:hypothetical protein
MPTRSAPSSTRLATVAASRALITVSAVAGVAAALVAAAPVRRAPQHRTPASQDAVDGVLRGVGATGPARAVWAWNPGFTAGDPGAEPLVRTLTWVSPTGGDGAPQGTVTARQTGDVAGSLRVTATGDDHDVARALRTLADDEVLVADGTGWLVVRNDRVRPLLSSAQSAPTRTPDPLPTVAEHRAARRERTAGPSSGTEQSRTAGADGVEVAPDDHTHGG